MSLNSCTEKEIFHPFEHLTEVEKAYLAGFIDGDGCICITRNIRKNRKTKLQYTLRLTLTNKNRYILECIKNILSTKKNFYKSIFEGITVYRLEFSSTDVIKLGRELYSFLKLKKEQLKVAIEFQKNIKVLSVIDKEQYYQRMKDLNKTNPIVKKDEFKSFKEQEVYIENISNIDKSYMAGFFDAEGYINIREKKSRLKMSYFSEIAVGNSDKRIMHWFCKTLGIKHIGLKNSVENFMVWSLYSTQAAIFLMAIKNYLRGKKKQAELLIKFQRNRKNLHIDERKYCYQEMKKLNRKT